MPIIIKKSTRNAANPFRVVYTGDNNEVLTNSEPLKTKQSCLKNIVAMSKVFRQFTGSLIVTDTTGKKEVKYELDLFSGKNTKV